MSKLNRREFLKISAALAASATFSGTSRVLSSRDSAASAKPNILVFLFDAMSARHLSLYGYSHETSPNLEKFAERATVYHQHYSAGNFTSAGTASMLTGMYPWTHRAFNYRSMVNRSLTDRNLFNLIGDEYTRFAFTQNLWADILLNQFEKSLDFHLPSESYSEAVHSLFQPDDMRGDRAMAYYVFQDFLNLRTLEPHPFPGSLFIATTELAEALTSNKDMSFSDYPKGLPTNYDFSYKVSTVFEGVSHFIQGIKAEATPYLAYFHFWSPHGPYNARQDFIGKFPDELRLPSKPQHPLAGDHFSEEVSRDNLLKYDECIAEVDAAFGELISDLEKSGVLQNSYVIDTSDHGELFERGEIGHASALMYAPVTHIPLLISAPGQKTHSDVHSLTSNLDLVPTLLQIAGKDIPSWIEGRLLPGFGGTED